MYDQLIKQVKLRILDTFSKQVGFGSTHITEYSWLDMTRHDTNPTREHKNISSTSLKIPTK